MYKYCINCLYLQTTPDGFCLPRAILKQVVHHQHAFTPDMLFRMAALQMVRKPHKYYRLVEWELIQTGESYESFCTNLFQGNVWGDDLVTAVIGDMWNLAISVVSPIYAKPVPLFHDKKKPDIVLVANGGSWLDAERPCTHFSATRPKDEDEPLPGVELVDGLPKNPTLAQDQIPRTLMPFLLHDVSKAKRLAMQEYLDTEKVRSLDLLRGVCVQIKNLENGVCKLISEAENFRRYKTLCEYKLEKLGVSADRIKEYAQLEDPEFCRTGEREKRDKEDEKKRKREEEEEMEKKRQKPTEPDEVVDEDRRKQQDYEETRYQQQKTMLQDQEIIIQKQSIELAKLNTELFALKNKQKEEEKVHEKHQEELDRLQDAELQYQQITKYQQGEGPSTSERSKGSINKFTQRMIKPEHLHFLEPVKKETTVVNQPVVIPDDDIIPEQSTQQVVSQAVIQQVVSQQPEIVVQGSTRTQYYPKVDKITHQVLLVPTQETSRNYSKRTTTKGAKHPDLRADGRFYCENCPCNYSRKAMLDKHVMFNCLKTTKDFVCDSCGKKYFDERTVREHFYHSHKKVYLYHCMQCNQGFYFRSKITSHKKACPNKGGPKLYKAMIDLDPVLEETFKRRIPIEVAEEDVNPEAIPQDVLRVADQEELEREEEEERERLMMIQLQQQQEQQQQQELIQDKNKITPEETKTATDILTEMSAGGGTAYDVEGEMQQDPEDEQSIEIETIDD